MKQDKMAVIVDMLDDVISAIDPATKTAPDAKITAVRAEVNKMMKDYPLFAW
jgi:glycine hydroxymethyltransferase